MKLTLNGDIESLMPGIEALKEDLRFTLGENGIPINIEQHSNIGLQVYFKNGVGHIHYHKTIHFFRAFGLLIEHLSNSKEFAIEESPQFETVGPMFDLSRNAVMNIKTFKMMIRKLALMGLDSAMLYMEDTYEIKDEPYFGYMRGRYTEKELKEIDDYGYLFGIEMIPCIQTLAHLEEFLKWDAVKHLRDTRGALLLENEETYTFIEKMITSASKPFRSSRIHIGMDEAEEVGRGNYLTENGYKSLFELMTKHLEKVLEIVERHDLKPMMWSDMFIKMASSSGIDHYNLETEIPEYMIEKTPKNVQFMYWNYFHSKEEEYIQMIQKHKAFGLTPAFAGGIWVWNSFGTNYSLSLRATDAALKACKKEGVRDVFVTLWGDDGYENNVLTALLGLQMYAEHAYAKELDREKLKRRVKFCTGIDEESFLLLSDLDETPGVSTEHKVQTNPSKFLLWQDVLLGLFDKHIEGLEIGSHYLELENRIKEQRNSEYTLDYIFEVPEKLASLLSVKSEIGLKLKKAYDQRNLSELRHIATTDIQVIIQKLKALHQAHREQWFKINKPFGWEVIDIRYGGAEARLNTVIKRIIDFVGGHIDQIEELEETRLFYSQHPAEGIGWCSYYYRMASPNVFFHVLPIS
ncbi:beta-N-acetylhexosaminidase [Fredinandcohnia quinoae]|uniref:Beta-N-acetylhexosaminidase n=1 Tax=Fredinandcohnia quinoae TaxID=2918902 RepID=A0AAW5E475_9BACI|nr:beta-N-acetylhexosaminidase [Fredinandcohnia sp. SECRCQ15]MCH1624131.1 beta-N-acetylhexosaminidase [Fredinandcohnia sp. SECRCQ15]